MRGKNQCWRKILVGWLTKEHSVLFRYSVVEIAVDTQVCVFAKKKKKKKGRAWAAIVACRPVTPAARAGPARPRRRVHSTTDSSLPVSLPAIPSLTRWASVLLSPVSVSVPPPPAPFRVASPAGAREARRAFLPPSRNPPRRIPPRLPRPSDFPPPRGRVAPLSFPLRLPALRISAPWC